MTFVLPLYHAILSFCYTVVDAFSRFARDAVVLKFFPDQLHLRISCPPLISSVNLNVSGTETDPRVSKRCDNPASPERTKRMTTFTELPLSAALQQKLAAAQFITLTPIQAGAIAPALEGKDVIGTSQTGSGKTLAFLIPIIEMLQREEGRHTSALVLLPTRELAMQVHGEYEKLRGKTMPKAALVIGGVSEKAQITGLRAGAGLVIATPGRLQDLMSRKLADLRHLKILVLDEADRMLDMGFLPATTSTSARPLRRPISGCPPRADLRPAAGTGCPTAAGDSGLSSRQSGCAPDAPGAAGFRRHRLPHFHLRPRGLRAGHAAGREVHVAQGRRQVGPCSTSCASSAGRRSTGRSCRTRPFAMRIEVPTSAFSASYG